MNDTILVEEYDSQLHSVSELAAEQNAAVDSLDAKMLKWAYGDGCLQFEHDHPFFVAHIGGLAVAGAGFNIQYVHTDVVELGAAYVSTAHRGHGIYHELTKLRLNYVHKHGLGVITFANEHSSPILQSDFNFTHAAADQVPSQAFELCAGCSDNPSPGDPACAATCCTRESILILAPSIHCEQM